MFFKETNSYTTQFTKHDSLNIIFYSLNNYGFQYLYFTRLSQISMFKFSYENIDVQETTAVGNTPVRSANSLVWTSRSKE